MSDTEKKLLEWIGWEETYFASNSFFSKEHNSACRNQLREIVKEYFHRCITIDLDNLCKDKKTCNWLKKTGIKVVECIVEQQKPTVTRELIDMICKAVTGGVVHADSMSGVVERLKGDGVEVVK